jgi:carbamate kinase
MADNQLIVVALGGNAITQEHQEGDVGEQFANSRLAAGPLADLVEQGHQVVVTHGNGPQIGNFLLRNWAAGDVIYPLPMQVAVAHVQGGMGYMIAQTLTNELASRGHDRAVATIVTTVLVDADDPSFEDPSKPIGRTMLKEDADKLVEERGWTVKRLSSGRYRRVVPSPLPRRILEIATIRRAVHAGDLIVACGGGGIPLVRDAQKGLQGVRAVIDKDLASALLASDLDADALIILTAVERVCINYGTPEQREIERMTVAEARGWMREGQFPPGSMGPKMQGAIEFLESSDKPEARVIIAHLDQAADALAGKAGTTIGKA